MIYKENSIIFFPWTKYYKEIFLIQQYLFIVIVFITKPCNLGTEEAYEGVRGNIHMSSPWEQLVKS